MRSSPTATIASSSVDAPANAFLHVVVVVVAAGLLLLILRRHRSHEFQDLSKRTQALLTIENEAFGFGGIRQSNALDRADLEPSVASGFEQHYRSDREGSGDTDQQ